MLQTVNIKILCNHTGLRQCCQSDECLFNPAAAFHFGNQQRWCSSLEMMEGKTLICDYYLQVLSTECVLSQCLRYMQNVVNIHKQILIHLYYGYI